MMRTIALCALLIFALCASARVADARTTGMIPVSVQVMGSCLIDASSTTMPIVCAKGTNAVVEQSSMSFAQMGALLAANGTSQLGLGGLPSSWKLITISL